MSNSKRIKLKNPIKNQILGLVIVSSGFFYGFTLCEFNNFFEYFIEGKFKDTIKLSDYNSINALLNTFMTMGGLTATLLSGFLINKLSLRTLVISSCLLHILFRFLQIWCNLPGLYVCHLCIGFIIATNCYICQMYILDLFPKEYVGFLNSSTGFFVSAGIITASFMKSTWTLDYWELVIFLPGFVDIVRLFFILLLFRYKTPFQILKGIDSKMEFSNPNSLQSNSQTSECLIDESKDSKTKGESGNFGKSESNSLLYDEFSSNPETQSYLDNFCEKEEEEQSLAHYFAEYLHKKNENSEGSLMSVLFNKKFRLQIWIGILINLLTQLTGTATVEFYSKTIFTGLNFSNPESLTIICSNHLFYFYIDPLTFIFIFLYLLNIFLGKSSRLKLQNELINITYFDKHEVD